MSERSRVPPAIQEPKVPDRLVVQDRRADARSGDRPPRAHGWVHWLAVAGRDLLIVITTVAAIAYSVNHVHPIFANQPSIAAQITKIVPASRGLLAPPPDTGKLADLVKSPSFERDRSAFAADL